MSSRPKTCSPKLQASDEGPGKIAAIARAETRLKVVKR